MIADPSMQDDIVMPQWMFTKHLPAVVDRLKTEIGGAPFVAKIFQATADRSNAKSTDSAVVDVNDLLVPKKKKQRATSKAKSKAKAKAAAANTDEIEDDITADVPQAGGAARKRWWVDDVLSAMIHAAGDHANVLQCATLVHESTHVRQIEHTRRPYNRSLLLQICVLRRCTCSVAVSMNLLWLISWFVCNTRRPGYSVGPSSAEVFATGTCNRNGVLFPQKRCGGWQATQGLVPGETHGASGYQAWDGAAEKQHATRVQRWCSCDRQRVRPASADCRRNCAR